MLKARIFGFSTEISVHGILVFSRLSIPLLYCSNNTCLDIKHFKSFPKHHWRSKTQQQSCSELINAYAVNMRISTIITPARGNMKPNFLRCHRLPERAREPRHGAFLPARDYALVPRAKFIFLVFFIPAIKTFIIDQACSVKIARHWPRSLFCGVFLAIDSVSEHEYAIKEKY